jgi:hypothetical protein
VYWSYIANPPSYSLQLLRTYADLASRAIRRDLMKPRIQENDFSAIETDRDGTMTVLNARFKTRIRASRQARRTWCCMKSYCSALTSFSRLT